MTLEQIKEQLSRNFVRLVAHRAGYKCKIDELDHGTDITIAEVKCSNRPTGIRLLETGRYLDLQLKCTCESRTIPTEGGFKYDLEAKTYNDLIERWEGNPATPLLLVLFVLPDDEATWLAVSGSEVILKRAAFWWRPAIGSGPTLNTSSVRIEVPRANLVGVDFVPARYAEFYE